MADTRVQLKVEDWVRKDWMPSALGQSFHRERLTLRSGGVFDFDAVSADRRVVATISTSGGTTASGKTGVGKLMKLRSDMLFLSMVPADRRIVLLTELDMYSLCLKEKAGGRIPPEVEFMHAALPAGLAAELVAARQVASKEVRPERKS